MQTRVYLDWNATAPLRPEARAAMLAALDRLGNASSVHREGQRARHAVEAARAQVALLVGAEPEQVTFTSGGSEANALALSPGWTVAGRAFDRLIVSAVEHPSVLSGGRFVSTRVERAPVHPDGVVAVDALVQMLAEGTHAGGVLVSIMAANNETGVVQPIRRIADCVHATGGILHVDAVQAPGRLSFDAGELGADLVTLSAHKIGGPLGVGALIRCNDALSLDAPLIAGGGQERGFRAGTENVPAIAGFGAAADAVRLSLPADRAHMRRLRDELEARLQVIAPVTVIFGEAVERLPNTTLFAVPDVKAETALITLDLAGFAVSSGSACSSGKVARSHVLAAMGVAPALAGGAIRISIGHSTQAADIDRFCDAWKACLATLTRGRPQLAA